MPSSRIWVVHAPYEIAEAVEQRSMVAIGWTAMGELSQFSSRETMKAKFREAYPGWSAMRVAVGAGQLFRFAIEMQPSDRVLTPLKETREVLIGACGGDYAYDPRAISEHYPNVRPVTWATKVSRDDVSTPLKNALGGLMTVFRVDDHIDEVQRLLGAPAEDAGEVQEEAGLPFHEDVMARSQELTNDLIHQIDAFDFQDLVAGLLRAVGYWTQVADRGPDGGVDIRAFSDPFGFHTPRVRVQVKHRTGRASSPEVQQFIGALGSAYQGLFVSTGGFTGQAISEASRHSNLRLMDRDEFVTELLANYERLDSESKALIPLRKVYIPVI